MSGVVEREVNIPQKDVGTTEETKLLKVPSGYALKLKKLELYNTASADRTVDIEDGTNVLKTVVVPANSVLILNEEDLKFFFYDTINLKASDTGVKASGVAEVV